ncbi:hypothetical protein [Rufibacter hautae]|uniref:MarR family transcriptional regulator n=1 Tax=Rufibacter hautae TaxID=2595005 RepID=A0A5B6TPE2_9BACT|nr:hypothetical protein [Rufibacter hautae]KAA3438283.1 hypothetical protein FOA19_13585 [Rufibacter hautae]
MAKESRILKAMYALVNDQESKTEFPLDAAAISQQTPGLSLGEIEQEMRDLEIKKLVQLDHAEDMTLLCRLTEAGVEEAEKAARH